MAALLGAAIGLGSSLLGSFGQRSAQRGAQRDARRLTAWENETNLQNWEYSKQLRDYEYNQSLRIYKKSVDIYGQQRRFNEDAAARSYEAEDRKYQEFLQSMGFQQQEALVSMLQQRGKAQNQVTTGRSMGRGMMDVLSQYGRNNAVMAENLLSFRRQNYFDRDQIRLQKQQADMDAFSRLGLAPQLPPTPPKPKPKPVAGGTSVNPLLTIGNSLMSAVTTGLEYASTRAPGTSFWTGR